MSKRLTILEYENGFVMPLKQVAVAQGNGAFLKEEIAMMLDPEDLDSEEVEIIIVQIKKSTNAKEYFGDKK